MDLARLLPPCVQILSNVPSVCPSFPAVDVRWNQKRVVAHLAANVWHRGVKNLRELFQVHAQAVLLNENHLSE